MKLKIFGVLFILIFVTACNKQDGSEKFTGFTVVGEDKENPKFYIDTKTAKQDIDGLLSFNMVKVLPDGYVIQNAQTDCKTNFNSSEAVKFLNDGTSQERFAAEIIALPSKDNVEINALVAMACTKGNYQVKTISDASLSENALQQLFDVTNSSKKIKIASDKLSSIWFEQSFQNGNNNLRVIFTKTQPLESNGEIDVCHVCSAEIGAVTYKKVNEGWQVLSKQQIGDIGSWGDAPTVTQAEILQISSDKLAFLISYGDIHQGFEETAKYVFLFNNDKWQNLGLFKTGESNEAMPLCGDEYKCWNYQGNISLLTEKKEYFELLVTNKGTEQDDKDNIVPAKNDIYHFIFNGKEYELKNELQEKQVVKQAEPNAPVAQINQQEVKLYKKWTGNWGNGIVSIVITEPCQISEFTNQGYTYSISSSIPIARLKKQNDAWQVSGDRAITVMGCWFKKEGELIHAKLRRKKDDKTWEQDFKLDDGSWVGE